MTVYLITTKIPFRVYLPWYYFVKQRYYTKPVILNIAVKSSCVNPFIGGRMTYLLPGIS